MMESKVKKIGEMGSDLETMKLSMDTLMEKRRTDEIIRRQMHDHIQKLKGSMRVFCRVKPKMGDRLSGLLEE